MSQHRTRKPSVYRKIRGFTDANIRADFTTLHNHVNTLHRALTLMIPRVVALEAVLAGPVTPSDTHKHWGADDRAHATLENGLMDLAQVPPALSPTTPACPWCYGAGSFAYRQPDGTTLQEPCRECSPQEFEAPEVTSDVDGGAQR